MDQIRYTQRICTDQERIQAFLGRMRVGTVGMHGGAYPYAVPVNFVWHNGCIYFHGMGSGKKEDLLQEGPPVCFTVYKEYGTVTDPVPCHADTSYMSVMLFGRAEKVTDYKEAAAVLQQLLNKFMPNFYKKVLNGAFIEKYRSSMDGNAVSVYRITPQAISAKENRAEPDSLFRPE